MDRISNLEEGILITSAAAMIVHMLVLELSVNPRTSASRERPAPRTEFVVKEEKLRTGDNLGAKPNFSLKQWIERFRTKTD